MHEGQVTHDLHPVPEREAERVDAGASVQPFDSAHSAQGKREPDGLAIERGESEIWWEEV